MHTDRKKDKAAARLRCASSTVCSSCSILSAQPTSTGREWDPFLMPYSNLNSKWIKGLNRTGNAKLLEENVAGKLHDTGLGNQFVEMLPKRTSHESQSRCMGPAPNSKAPAQPRRQKAGCKERTERERACASLGPDQRLISKICKTACDGHPSKQTLITVLGHG